MFQNFEGSVLFTLIEQIDQLATFTSFTVAKKIVPHPAGGMGIFFDVVATAADAQPRTIFFSGDEKTAHNFRDLAEIGSAYFRNLSSH